MKKVIFIVIVIAILVVAGGAVAYANIDSPIFDRFYSQKAQEQRVLDRMVQLYPETIGEYSLYSWSIEKIRKESECENVNETINRINGNLELKGEVCSRYTIGQYRLAGSNKVVFVHIFKMTKGAEVMRNILLNMSFPDKVGGNFFIRPERHELGWLTNSGVDYILTQEGTFKAESDGGESMDYSQKATGENAVAQYFMSNFSPTQLSNEQLSSLCWDSDGKNYENFGSTEGIYFDSTRNEARREKVNDVCLGDPNFSAGDKSYYIKSGILTTEQTQNKNILIEFYCDNGLLKPNVYECSGVCSNGACVN